MIEVSKDKFFQAIGQPYVHPRTGRDYSSWETPSRRVVGKTTPGYACRDADSNYTSETKYFLKNYW